MATTAVDIHRILCAVDFSEFSAPALERAIRLGDWFEAGVEVLHVIPFSPFLTPAGLGPGYFPDPVELRTALREQASHNLADLVDSFRGEGVPIVTKILEGEPWRVILEEARSVPADLLVIGTHGRSGFEQLLLGSVTEKVLRRAPCPVLTVGRVRAHSRKGPLFRRILCGADLTQASQHTLDTALSLATENDSQITLLHVMETLSGELGGGGVTGIRSPAERESMAAARAELRKAVPDSARALCRVVERVEAGPPWTEILRVAEQMDAELIVMGAHARGAVDRMLFGSTVSQVIRRARCPVLIIRESLRPQPGAQVKVA